MKSSFLEIRPEDITDNPFRLIGSDWMLITAGTIKSFNTMTASWGGLGVLWNKNIAICFIRPHRYTFNFIENSEYFTLSFFESRYKDKLAFCGSHSGKDTDKVKQTGLTPVEGIKGDIYFDEARLVLECRKLYFQDLESSNFLDPAISHNYPAKDYHRMYIGEVVRGLEKK